HPANAAVLLPDDLGEMIGALGDAAYVPDGRQKQVGLTAVDWQAGEKRQQVRGGGNPEGEPLVDLGGAAYLIDRKTRVALRYALEFSLPAHHSGRDARISRAAVSALFRAFGGLRVG